MYPVEVLFPETNTSFTVLVQLLLSFLFSFEDV